MRKFAEISNIVNDAFLQIDWNIQPEGLYKPIGYILSLGGKRIRPALALMATELFDGNIDSVLKPAMGVEIFHNFTLLHDDIMDKAPIRRAKPTVHVKWNDNTAILSGDVMQIIAYQYIAKTPVRVLPEVLNLFSVTAAAICEGQQYDMDFENRTDVSVEEYIEMIRLKTAVLLGCSLKIGAVIANAPSKDADLLYDFGINLGLAFQLKDDLLDVYGNPDTFGKQVGGDIISNKKTYMLISALDLAKNEDKSELNYWLGIDEFDVSEKVKKVTQIYNRLNIRAICEEKMNEYFKNATKCLDEVDVPSEKKKELTILANSLMNRIS